MRSRKWIGVLRGKLDVAGHAFVLVEDTHPLAVAALHQMLITTRRADVAVLDHNREGGEHADHCSGKQ